MSTGRPLSRRRRGPIVSNSMSGDAGSRTHRGCSLWGLLCGPCQATLMLGADPVCHPGIVERLFLPNQRRLPFGRTIDTDHFMGHLPVHIPSDGIASRKPRGRGPLVYGANAGELFEFAGESRRKALGGSGSGLRLMYPSGYTGSLKRIRSRVPREETGRGCDDLGLDLRGGPASPDSRGPLRGRRQSRC